MSKKLKSENKKTNKNNKLYTFIIIIVFLLIISFFLKIIIGLVPSSGVKSVKKIIKPKYSSITCVDSYCNGVIATKLNSKKQYIVELYNKNGKRLAKYKEKDSNKYKKTIYEISDKYFISKKEDKNNNNSKYLINNKSGKTVYSTKNRLTVLNNNYIVMEDRKKDTFAYSILNSKGKEIYSNIKNINSYIDGNIISIEMKKKSYILDSKMKKILNNYVVEEAALDNENNVKYLIVKDTKNGVYNYFNIKTNKIVGNDFIGYKKQSDNNYIITDKNNNKFELSDNGKQKKIEKIYSYEMYNSIKNKIDNKKYYLYSTSIYKKSQNNILVDNLESKELGILNLDTKKFTSLYSYKEDSDVIYSRVTKLNDNDSDLYLQISCSSDVCGVDKTIVYDFEHLKELYNFESKDLIMNRYTEYSNDYKVIKYSLSSDNRDYAGKYVLYDQNNKEILKKDAEIVVVDKKIMFGKSSNINLYLYSVKKKKLLDSKMFEKLDLNGKIFYKLQSNDRYLIYDEDINKIISKDGGGYYSYNDTSLIYLKNNKISIYNIEKNNIKTYELKENEKMSYDDGEMIPSYKGASFINNVDSNYAKVINLKGKSIKKIRGSIINKVSYNKNNKMIYIITSRDTKKGTRYGLYIAK